MGQAFCRTGGMRVRPLVSPSQPPPSRPPNLAASVQVPFPPHTQGQDSPSVGVAVVVVHGCWMSRPHHARDAYGAPPPQEWGLQEEIRDGDAQDGIAARWNLAAFLFRCIASRPCGGGGGGASAEAAVRRRREPEWTKAAAAVGLTPNGKAFVSVNLQPRRCARPSKGAWPFYMSPWARAGRSFQMQAQRHDKTEVKPMLG